jgi:hypothetical protein
MIHPTEEKMQDLIPASDKSEQSKQPKHRYNPNGHLFSSLAPTAGTTNTINITTRSKTRERRRTQNISLRSSTGRANTPSSQSNHRNPLTLKDNKDKETPVNNNKYLDNNYYYQPFLADSFTLLDKEKKRKKIPTQLKLKSKKKTIP